MNHFVASIVVTTQEDPDFHLEKAIEQIKEGFTFGVFDFEENDGSWGRMQYSLTEEKALPKGVSYFLVKIKQRDGDYETQLTAVVKASSVAEAEKLALEGVLHHELGNGAYEADNGIYDRHGEVHYSIQSVNRLDPEEALILKRFNI